MSNEKEACLTCHEKISDSQHVTCSSCEYDYHTGSCSGVMGRDLKKQKTDGTIRQWLCKTCENSSRRGGTSTPDKVSKENCALKDDVVKIQTKLNALLPLIEKIDSLLELKGIAAGLQKSVEHMSDQYDQVMTRLTTQDREIAEVKVRVSRVERLSDEQELSSLRCHVNDEQYGRRQNLEIHGLSRSDNENLLDAVNYLGVSLGLTPLSEPDIESIHCLPAKNGHVPPVIIRFVARKTKENWQQKGKRELRESGSKVRFYDNLTPQNKRLLWLTCTKASEIGYRYVWQKDGKILVRKGSGEPVLRVSNESDLSMLTNAQLETATRVSRSLQANSSA